MISRRLLLLSPWFASLPNTAVTSVDGLPTTGAFDPSMRSFDGKIIALLKQEALPGAALAVVENGRLVYARGYGWADKEQAIVAQPTSGFRLASVSKPITAVAVMTVVQDRRYGIDLDTPVFPLLGLQPFLPAGRQPDRRLGEITVRHLLEHAGGWDRARSGDVMFRHFQIAREMKIASPPDHRSLIRWAIGRPLDFTPGTKHVYSNFGYCVLGRVIEKATGLPYETYVRTRVLLPMGIKGAYVGGGRRRERRSGEVRYYDRENRTARSVFSEDGDAPVPLPYAFASPRTMDAHGGWVASAVDIARFAAYLDVLPPNSILRRESLAALYARPPAPLGREEDGTPSAAYYALGWMVRPVGNASKANCWHGGAMPGTSTILVRLANGRSWTLLLNQRTEADIDGLLHQAAAGVTRWPRHDLFDLFRTEDETK